MPLVNLASRVFIVITIIGLALTILPMLITAVLPTVVWYLLSGLVLFVVSWLSHTIGFDILPWIP